MDYFLSYPKVTLKWPQMTAYDLEVKYDTSRGITIVRFCKSR